MSSTNLAKAFLGKLNDLDLPKGYTVNDFYEEMKIPKEQRSDFATTAIIKQALEMRNIKYIAIKVKGITHWMWFDLKMVKRDNGKFAGKHGWGKRGALTNITVSEDEIVGELYSDELQYA